MKNNVKVKGKYFKILIAKIKEQQINSSSVMREIFLSVVGARHWFGCLLACRCEHFLEGELVESQDWLVSPLAL